MKFKKGKIYKVIRYYPLAIEESIALFESGVFLIAENKWKYSQHHIDSVIESLPKMDKFEFEELSDIEAAKLMLLRENNE